MVGCCLAVGPDGSLFVAGYTEGYLPLLPTYTPLQSIYGGGFSDDFLMVLSPAASGLTGVTTIQSQSGKRIPDGRPAGGGTLTLVKQ
jgi:hypothetical protein